jgi:hypothetical protein
MNAESNNFRAFAQFVYLITSNNVMQAERVLGIKRIHFLHNFCSKYFSFEQILSDLRPTHAQKRMQTFTYEQRGGYCCPVLTNVRKRRQIFVKIPKNHIPFQLVSR